MICVCVCQIALLDSPTALSMEEKLQQNEARVSLLFAACGGFTQSYKLYLKLS